MAVNYLVGEDLKFSWSCSSGGGEKKIKKTTLPPTLSPHFTISPFIFHYGPDRRRSSEALSPLAWSLISSKGNEILRIIGGNKHLELKSASHTEVHTVLQLILIVALLTKREAAVNWDALWLIAYNETEGFDLSETPEYQSFYGKHRFQAWERQMRKSMMVKGKKCIKLIKIHFQTSDQSWVAVCNSRQTALSS